LNPLNSDGHSYGLHPACRELQAMFNGTPMPVNGNTNAGKLAALFNTGTLVYPLTKQQYQSGSVARPPQLFRIATRSRSGKRRFPIVRRRPAGADVARI
jgi:hypothetical protein